MEETYTEVEFGKFLRRLDLGRNLKPEKVLT